MRIKLVKHYCHFAAACLVVVAVSKLFSALGHQPILQPGDAILRLRHRAVFILVALIELGVARVCWLNQPPQVKAVMVAWLASQFLLYRLGLWWMQLPGPCKCLGNLTDALPFPPHVLDNMMLALLGYLLVGSYGILAWHWRRPHPETALTE